jgi:hypothetical protein
MSFTKKLFSHNKLYRVMFALPSYYFFLFDLEYLINFNFKYLLILPNENTLHII